MSRTCNMPLCTNQSDWKFCDLHRCRKESCAQQKETCTKHTRKCSLKSCNERYREIKTFCQKHRCPEPSCDGFDQCPEHAMPCAVAKCTYFINTKSTFQYCKQHRCYIKGCLGSHQCADHFCKGLSKYGCNSKKTVEEAGCVYCKCPQCNVLKSECKEHCCEYCYEPTREQSSKYCFRCVCKVADCLLHYRKCPHKCRTKDCMSRRGENGFCESRCFFRGESTSDEAKEILLKMKIDHEKEHQTFELYNNFGFNVPRLDFKTILSRHKEIEFAKTFRKIAGEKIEKTRNYLPKCVVARCVDYCSEDNCECGNVVLSFDDNFSVLKPLNEIFGTHFKLRDGNYILSDTILASAADDEDGDYGWVISANIIDKAKTETLKDDEIQEAIQCMVV